MPDQSLMPMYPRQLGVVLDVAEPDLVEAHLDVEDRHGNRNGVAHGGVVMAIGDALGGIAAFVNLTGDDRTTTIESKTNFIRPLPLGSRASARCVPIHKGRRTSIWQTTVTRADGKPAAIVTQTQLTLPAGS